MLVWLVAGFIFFRRYPGNFTQPNFYAEDGSVFGRNIIDHGLLRALGTTFNGYYIWGLYLLEKIGFVFNYLFFGNQFANLPRSFALTSYLFLGFMATLPLLLFKKYLRPQLIALIVVLAVFVPMTSYDYAIIGTLGNLKFAFTYLAFLLLVYRHLMPRDSKKVYLVDIGLLICAYTNITVYPMMLFALLRYLPRDIRHFRSTWRTYVRELLTDRTFQSLVGLGILLLPQLYVVKTYGVPELKGYLDAPFRFSRTIEIFVARSYLYSVLFPVNKLLSDGLVVALAVAVLGGGYWLAGKYRKIFVFGILTVFLATFLFVIKRTGISDFYTGYHDGGPDQFFYAQNWIFSFVFSIVVIAAIDKLKTTRLRTGAYVVLGLIVAIVLVPKAGTYGRTDFMADSVGTIYAVAKQQCDGRQDSLQISIYPSSELKYTGLSRQRLCTAAVTTYHPQVVRLGLVPYNNKYLDDLGGHHSFTQTFVSPQDNLDGVGVYFSTFLRKVRSPYTLTLYEKDCTTTVRSVRINTGKIHDNAFDTITFPVVTGAKDQTYCFRVSTARQDRVDPLAVQLSKPDQYPAGQAVINGAPSDQDVVFELHYR